MKAIFRFIRLIFRGIWKGITFIRLALVNILFLLMIGLFYFSYTQTAESLQPIQIEESALILNLNGPLVEQSQYVNPMDSISGSLLGKEMPKENVIFDVVEAIRYAKYDDNVKGLVLALRDLPETNLTKLRYVAKAINEFKGSGKPVYAVGDFYNQSQYYLASYADKIFLSPDGGVLIKGYSAYSMYYKTLLEKLDISTHVFRVGTYKSAIEPFTRDNMSDESKESATRWVTQLWAAYVYDVTNNRDIDAKVLNPSMDEFLATLKSVNGDVAQLSVKLGLVDELVTRQEIRQRFAQEFGSDGKDSYKAIGYYEYLTSMQPTIKYSDNDVAIVVTNGAIMDGQQPRGSVGGDSIATLLRQARNDENVKAVVLRVNSPGGSAFASEVIRNEVEALKAAGKPVVASMSSLAASGGYWISTSADKIVAQPTTLTGSIGIFSVITTFEKGLNKLGVRTDGIGTSPFSGEGLSTGLSEGASQAIQLGIEHGYQRFISLVSQSRSMSVEEVDKIAQGRVWTGQDAMQHGLVDQMGDFDDAVALAAELAGLKDYNIYWVEEPLSATELFVKEFLNQAKVTLGLDLSSWVPASILPIAQQIQQDASLLQSFNDPKGHYAFCLNCQVH